MGIKTVTIVASSWFAMSKELGWGAERDSPPSTNEVSKLIAESVPLNKELIWRAFDLDSADL
jgi:hypothetical protein